MQGNRVRTQGVVTAASPGSTGLSGFFLQTAGEEGVGYDTPGASDGIFIHTGNRSTPAVGDSVEVTGVVHENFGMTRLLTVRDSQIVDIADLDPVVPNDQLPAADCDEGACLTGSALAAAREEYEGEAFLPTDPYTVTDSYDGGATSSSMYGEFTLAANSADPLYVPLELARPGSQRATDITNYNAAHQVVLDDSSSVNYTSNTALAFPWLTPTNSVRAGAAVTFVKPVVLDFAFGVWRLQPEVRIPSGNNGSDWVEFDQDRPAAPDAVGGDLKIATFNMLNYFPTTGEAWDSTTARKCTYYTDRQSNRITNNTCEENATDPVTGLPVVIPGPRGAATEVSFLRQEAKEIRALNSMDADVVSLEEVENSIKMGLADRDSAVKHLVAQLNADWASTHPTFVGDRWAYAPSPRAEARPTVTEEDAIRSPPSSTTPPRSRLSASPGSSSTPLLSATPASRSPRPSRPRAREGRTHSA